MKDFEFPDVIDITSHNRYGIKLELIKILGTERSYKLSQESYMRYSTEDDQVLWIDPDGGPFMGISYKVTDKLSIEKIGMTENGSFYIQLKSYY